MTLINYLMTPELKALQFLAAFAKGKRYQNTFAV
jgi:hypothetical protein